MSFNTISVIGLGYIGLPTAAVIASRGKNVVGVDTSQQVVDTINKGEIHIVEPELDRIVHTAVTEGYLRVTTAPESADAFLIAVPTPFKGDHEPDISYIESAAKVIAPVLKKGDLVILESTSPVGATEQMAAWLAEERHDLRFPQTHGEDSDIRIAYCPERVLPGHVVQELVENDRVIGGMTPKCSEAAASLYKTFVKGKCVVTNARTAENARLIRVARELNDSKPEWVLEKVRQAVGDFLRQHPDKMEKDVTVACFGLAFKPDIDDLRESPALQIARELSRSHPGAVLAVEPNISSLPEEFNEKCSLVDLDTALTEADIQVLLVAHREFKSNQKVFGKRAFLIDAAGIIEERVNKAMDKSTLQSEKNLELMRIDTHDRVTDAYYGKLGERFVEFMQETRGRIHWICTRVTGYNILDVGCSQGIVPILLAREGCIVTGIDISPRAIEEASQYLAQEPQGVQDKVDFVNADFMEMDIRANEVDSVVMSEMLEHLTRPYLFVEKAANLLRKTNGTLIVTVPFGINDYIDHKQTFYLKEPFELLGRFFEEVDYEILGKWVGFVAKMPRAKGANGAELLPGVVEKLEKGFLHLDRLLNDKFKVLSKKISKLVERNQGLSDKLVMVNRKHKDATSQILATKKQLQQATVKANEAPALKKQLQQATAKANEAPALKQQLQQATVKADEVPALKKQLQQATVKADEVPALKKQLQQATVKADEVPALKKQLQQATVKADEVPALKKQLQQATARADEVPALKKQLQQATVRADEVPVLKKQLQQATVKADEVPALRKQLQQATVKADEVPALRKQLQQATVKANKVPVLEQKLDAANETYRTVFGQANKLKEVLETEKGRRQISEQALTDTRKQLQQATVKADKVPVLEQKLDTANEKYRQATGVEIPVLKDRLAAQSDRTQELQGKLDVLTKDLYKEKKEAGFQQRKKEIQKRKNESLETHLITTKRQLSMIRGSTTYRISTMFAKDVKRPLHWPLMPIKIYRIYRLTKKRRSQKVALLEELSGYEITPLVPIKKRVCYVLHNSLPYASGGYATRSHGVAVALSARGYDVQVVTRAGYPLDAKDTNFTIAEDSVIDGIPYRRILDPKITGKKLENYMKLSINAYVDFFRLNRPAYVVAASSFRHALPAIIAAKRLGIPTVYEVRGFWEVTRISREPSFKSSKAYEYQRRMEAETANTADQVFTLTYAMKDELVKRGVTASHIAITPNACDPDRFVPRGKNAELREHLGIPEGVPVIGYIGSWVHYEGLDDLVSACVILLKKGVEFRCLIVGSENVATDTRGPIYDAIKNIVKGSKLAEWVITPGRVPFDEVRDYYSLIDIASFPRRALPVTEMVSPMKPLEALAMEKAVVVSSVKALNEMIEDGVTGLVFQKGSISDLAEKLEQLIADDELRRKLGVNGRNHILRERNWASISIIMDESIAGFDDPHTKGEDELSRIRKLALDTDRPIWWSQLPQEFSKRCGYLSLQSWVISKKTRKLAKRYEKKFDSRAVKKRIPVLNWKRADVCWRIVPDDASILDIGSGLGEFVSLVAMHNPMADITSVDTRNHDLWFDSIGQIKRIYKDIFDLGSEHERDIVTCFEVLEHLPPARLVEAVEKLHSLARKKLYISVPFMEGPPLHQGHYTRFTVEKILHLFPDATFTVFDKKDFAEDDKVYAWILCEMDP